MELLNETRFAAAWTLHLDKSAREQLVVAVKAIFAIGDGRLPLAEKQEALRVEDEFLGKPGESSLCAGSELEPQKRATDIFLRGHARAPKPGTRLAAVTLQVGPVKKTACVFGDRLWRRTLTGAQPSDPKPFEVIALSWENAFGGIDRSAADPRDHEGEPRNPVGRGFLARRTARAWQDLPLPNVENPSRVLARPQDRLEPMGFGPLARDWQPRASRAGTYDQRWMDERMPLLPLDFDERFFNAAPPDQIVAGYLKGGEPVQVVGCTPRPLAFSLPRTRVSARVALAASQSLPLALDSATVDVDALQLTLLWKGQLDVHEQVESIREIAVAAEELP